MEEKMEENIKCVACEISEDEAKKIGRTIEIVNFIETDFGTAEVMLSDGRTNYICSECKKKFDKMVSSGEMKKMKDSIDTFENFIDSSASLFRLEASIVLQSCINLYVKGVMRISNKNVDTSISILKASMGLFYRTLDELENIKNENSEAIKREKELKKN